MPGPSKVWNFVDHTIVDGAPAVEPTESAPTGATRRNLRLPAVAAVAALLIGGGIATASAHKTITLDVDGTVTELGTFAGSVESLLEARGVELAERDVVAPALDTALADGDEVVVRVARPFTVATEDGEATVWTTERTVAEALDTLSTRGEAATVLVSRSAVDGRHGLSLDLAVSGRIHVRADGRTLSVTGAQTAAEALTMVGVEHGPADRVTVATGETGLVAVTVQRVEVVEVVEVTEVPFASVTEETDELYRGESTVARAGVPGEVTQVYSVTLVDGVEESRALVSEDVLGPVTQVVREGTKARPVVVTGGGGGTVVGGDVWGQLAQCESGGNPTIVSRNGKYYGLYQFSLATWQSVGGVGLPTENSAEEQTYRAQLLQARSGWGQWPACARKLGLL